MPPATKRPALLGDKEPVSILSDALTYDEANKKAEYAGQTRLLQGQTTINADKLTLDETKGDLTATGKVVTNLRHRQQAGRAGQPNRSRPSPAPRRSPIPTTRAWRPTRRPRSSTAIRAT